MDYNQLSDEALYQMINTCIRDRKRITKLELELKDIQMRRKQEAKDEYPIIIDPKSPPPEYI